MLPRLDTIEVAFSAARKKGAEYIVTEAMVTAFEKAQRIVMDMPMMMFVDPNRPLYLEVDASDTGTGALLFQEQPNPLDPSTPIKEPIRWTSHMFTPAALKWPTIEKEGFAIIRAVTAMEMMLLGRPFILRTDHRNLLYMGHSTNLRVQRWYSYLSRYDITLEHIPGETNIVADALSRMFYDNHVRLPGDRSPMGDIRTVSGPMEDSDEPPDLLPIRRRSEEIQDDNSEDDDENAHRDAQNEEAPRLRKDDDDQNEAPLLKTTAYELQTDPQRTQLIQAIPEDNDIRDRLQSGAPLTKDDTEGYFKRFHSGAIGHLNLNATILAIENLLERKPAGLRQAITRLVLACPACAKSRTDRRVKNYERHSLSGHKAFSTLQVDFLTGLPLSEDGYSKLLVLVDTFTRFAILLPVKDETAQSACNAFLQVYGTYGTPDEMHVLVGNLR